MTWSSEMALLPLRLMLSKFSGGSFCINSFIEMISSLRYRHFWNRLSMVIRICPCSVVLFIFLEVMS
jgi:hypothetical protein